MSFNQAAPSFPTVLNTSNCLVFGNTAATAMTVRQLGSGHVMNVVTSTGSSAFFVNSSGQTGFGTTNPAASVDVTGNVYASNAVTTTNLFSTTANVGTLSVTSNMNFSGPLATLANLYVPGLATFANLTVSNLLVTGNLIVTATNVQTTNAFTINNSGTTTALKVTQNEPSLHTHNVAEFWDATTIAMVIDPRGNVAIHTVSSPDYALTVTDPANFETLYIRGKTGAASLNVTGNITASNSVTTTNVFATTVSGTNVIGTHYGVLAGSNTVSGSTQTLGGTAGVTTLNVTGNLYASNAVTTTNVFTTNVFATGRIGIGTSSPLYALDIVGQPRYSIQPVLQATQLGIASSAAAGWYRISSLGPTARAKFRIYTSGANLQEQVVVTTAWSAAFSGYPTLRIEDQSSATFAGTQPLFNGQIRTLVYVSSNGTWYLEVYLGSVATAYTLYVQLIEGDASGASITLTSPIVAGSIPTNYTAQPVVPVNSFSVSTWNGGNSALLIDYTGKVGIGIVSPGALFQVNAAVINPTIPTVHIGDNANDYGATYGMVHLVRNATPGDTKAHLTFIRNGNTGVNFGFYNNTNTFGIWHGLQNTSATPTIAVSSTGNVGIGTTGPGYKLDVSGDVRGNSFIVNGNGTWAAGSIYSDSNWGILMRMKQASPALAQFAMYESTGVTQLMNIDTSYNANFTGIVKSGTNPAWNLGKYGQANQSGVITYSQTDYSRNVTIVLGSGTVQVPVAGFYQINFHYFIDAGQAGSGGTYFRVNGSKVAARNYSSEATAYRPGHISAVISVAANDIFSVGSDIILHGNDNCNFSGHLIA